MYEEINAEEHPAEDHSTFHHQTPDPEGYEQHTPAADMQRRGPVRVYDEIALRFPRNQQLLEQREEVHDKKLEEQSKKIELVDLQIELVRMQMAYEAGRGLQSSTP
uniref:Alpha-defensin-related sequence 12 n=1 Tax=Lygus hesperus TaxID=30085 RepID=A0A0A9YL48_LYGHE